MLLALLSDTHDHPGTTLRALEILAGHHPAAYLHAGDMVSPSMLALFSGLPLYFVFGNNEYDHASLRSEALARGFFCLGDFGDLTVAEEKIFPTPPAESGAVSPLPPGGLRIGILHGHDAPRVESLARSGDYRYLVHGHTHVTRDQKFSHAQGPATRIINPGALYRARTKTVALLDTGADHLQFFEVPAA